MTESASSFAYTVYVRLRRDVLGREYDSCNDDVETAQHACQSNKHNLCKGKELYRYDDQGLDRLVKG